MLRPIKSKISVARTIKKTARGHKITEMKILKTYLIRPFQKDLQLNSIRT